MFALFPLRLTPPLVHSPLLQLGQDGLIEVKPPAAGAPASSAAAEQALQRLASYVVHLEI